MKQLVVLASLILVGCGNYKATSELSSNTGDSRSISEPGQIRPSASFETLAQFVPQCEHAEAELAQLKRMQMYRNFNEDPEKLNPKDAEFNAYLKAMMWYYPSQCNPEDL